MSETSILLLGDDKLAVSTVNPPILFASGFSMHVFSPYITYFRNAMSVTVLFARSVAVTYLYFIFVEVIAPVSIVREKYYHPRPC